MFELSCQIAVDRFTFETTGGDFGQFWPFWVIGDYGVWWACEPRIGGGVVCSKIRQLCISVTKGYVNGFFCN